MVLAQNRHIDQWNRIQGPDINSHWYGQLVYGKEDKMYHKEKKALSVNGVGKLDRYMQKNEIGLLRNQTMYKNEIKMDQRHMQDLKV